ncbi:hypothetical protein SK128_009137 [Halocaridina rubra]|uniref:Uncharacterized protein n=1 Tax=Halocaridina rubra TaxID=373956 RepID=A0AAN8XNH8_HALRR
MQNQAERRFSEISLKKHSIKDDVGERELNTPDLQKATSLKIHESKTVSLAPPLKRSETHCFTSTKENSTLTTEGSHSAAKTSDLKAIYPYLTTKDTNLAGQASTKHEYSTSSNEFSDVEEDSPAMMSHDSFVTEPRSSEKNSSDMCEMPSVSVSNSDVNSIPVKENTSSATEHFISVSEYPFETKHSTVSEIRSAIPTTGEASVTRFPLIARNLIPGTTESYFQAPGPSIMAPGVSIIASELSVPATGLPVTATGLSMLGAGPPVLVMGLGNPPSRFVLPGVGPTLPGMALIPGLNFPGTRFIISTSCPTAPATIFTVPLPVPSDQATVAIVPNTGFYSPVAGTAVPTSGFTFPAAVVLDQSAGFLLPGAELAAPETRFHVPTTEVAVTAPVFNQVSGLVSGSALAIPRSGFTLLETAPPVSGTRASFSTVVSKSVTDVTSTRSAHTSVNTLRKTKPILPVSGIALQMDNANNVAKKCSTPVPVTGSTVPTTDSNNQARSKGELIENIPHGDYIILAPKKNIQSSKLTTQVSKNNLSEKKRNCPESKSSLPIRRENDSKSKNNHPNLIKSTQTTQKKCSVPSSKKTSTMQRFSSKENINPKIQSNMQANISEETTATYICEGKQYNVLARIGSAAEYLPLKSGDICTPNKSDCSSNSSLHSENCNIASKGFDSQLPDNSSLKEGLNLGLNIPKTEIYSPKAVTDTSKTEIYSPKAVTDTYKTAENKSKFVQKTPKISIGSLDSRMGNHDSPVQNCESNPQSTSVAREILIFRTVGHESIDISSSTVRLPCVSPSSPVSDMETSESEKSSLISSNKSFKYRITYPSSVQVMPESENCIPEAFKTPSDAVKSPHSEKQSNEIAMSECHGSIESSNSENVMRVVPGNSTTVKEILKTKKLGAIIENLKTYIENPYMVTDSFHSTLESPAADGKENHLSFTHHSRSSGSQSVDLQKLCPSESPSQDFESLTSHSEHNSEFESVCTPVLWYNVQKSEHNLTTESSNATIPTPDAAMKRPISECMQSNSIIVRYHSDASYNSSILSPNSEVESSNSVNESSDAQLEDTYLAYQSPSSPVKSPNTAIRNLHSALQNCSSSLRRTSWSEGSLNSALGSSSLNVESSTSSLRRSSSQIEISLPVSDSHSSRENYDEIADRPIELPHSEHVNLTMGASSSVSGELVSSNNLAIGEDAWFAWVLQNDRQVDFFDYCNVDDEDFSL